MKFTNRTIAIVLALAWFYTAPVLAVEPSADMAKAANEFLTSLKPEQRAKAAFELNSEERKNWHFVPKQRNGLPFKEMTEAQRELSHTLLKSGLGKSGYVKATTVMSLEQVLFDLENKNPTRNPELYFVSIFGKPDTTNTWGWRVEGHHLSINFTIVKGMLFSTTPSFFGSNPGEIKEGPRKGLRPLANEEDLGRTLVKSLSAEQKKVAVFSVKAPRDIITGNSRKVEPLEQVGLKHSDMTKEQRATLMKLIRGIFGEKPK